MLLDDQVRLAHHIFFFFFSSRRRHTRFDCDWSSDVCSSDLNAHMFVGDAYRAQKNLEKAREEYLRGHALEPRNAVLLVKAGHANTFLGDYPAARADYDSAMALGRANEKAAYAPFRAYVSVYAGDPGAAIAELNRLVASVDGMRSEERRVGKEGRSRWSPDH